MSLQERAKAVAKDIEGKVEEAVGNVTGDTNKQLEGKAKQAEAVVLNTAEDVKDKAKDVAEAIKDKAKDTAKDIKNSSH